MPEPIKVIASGSLFDGKVDCHVLEGERRVISQRGVLRALGGARTGDLGRYLSRLPRQFTDLSLAPEIDTRLQSGALAKARDAEFLVDLCDAYVDAHMAGELRSEQVHLAHAARAVLKAVQKVGIVALIDEATNYQVIRASDSLQRLFERLLRSEPAVWEARWKPSLIGALCRLYRHRYDRGPVPPFLARVFAKIYRIVLGDEVLDEMRRRNPEPQHGSNHHQWLQGDVQRLLDDDLRIVELLAKQSARPSEFWNRMRAHYRHEPLQIELVAEGAS
jgi:hypothetical protein